VTAAAPIGGKRPAACAVAGALVFVGSLVYGAWSYIWRFGDTPPLAFERSTGAAAWNVLLFTLFALHHSVFARTPLRQWTARIVSPALERSAYVWIASLLFIVVLAAWQPVGGVAWRADGSSAAILAAGQIVGLCVTLRAAGALDVYSLAGVRQAVGGASSAPATVLDSGLYGFVRHPLYFGWALMVWLAPTMNGTRLVFAAVSTLYLVLAIPLEERSLRREFGDAYDRYADRVRWRMLWGIY
jgi:protein-S-isoprenylcysteine O-methyltransferase Ste14